MRRGFRGKAAEMMSGRLAWFDGECRRCDGPILVQESLVVPDGKGNWIHTTCASGQDG